MLDRTEVGRSIDVLGEILETVRLQVVEVLLAQCDAVLPLNMTVDRGYVIVVVLRGRVTADLGHDRLELGAGDALAILRSAHLASPTTVEPRQDSGVGWGVRGATGVTMPEQAAILRCNCRLDNSDRHPLLGALPSVIHVARHQWSDLAWLHPTTAWIEREIENKNDGSKAITSRLIELLWIQLIRAHLASTGAASSGWLRALSDTQIGEALGLIHGQPATRFTVAGLAHAVGMSRSAFACQFTRLVGEPPLHYIAQWRMLRATQLLKDDKHTLAEIALAVGYESEAAFSKAFKRWAGQAPGSYRRGNKYEPGLTTQMLAG